MKILSVAALYMALAVACGAFGAHALRDSLLPHDMAIWEKAVLYHLVHALAVIVVVLAPERCISGATAHTVGWLLLGSITVFSGTLYLLVLFNQRWLGMITPLGGSGLVIAWIWLAVGFWRAALFRK
jgi:uncharacterized membrane protein YgdD (TMEM256/DUF423 family)